MHDLIQFSEVEILHPDFAMWRIKNFFSPELLDFFEQNVRHRPFELHESYKENGEFVFSEKIQKSNLAAYFKMVMNDEDFIKKMIEKTQIQELREVVTRIYKLEPNSADWFNWHDDLGSNRALGFSINLTKDPYEGGVFMIKHREGSDATFEYQNSGYGDAIFFNIGPHLHHCVTPVKGSVTKYSCAGWIVT